jgi:hypothetical protein
MDSPVLEKIHKIYAFTAHPPPTIHYKYMINYLRLRMKGAKSMNRAMLFQRFLAVMVLVLPGFAGTYGWILMKDVWFASLDPNIPFAWPHFLFGLFLFIFGIAFIGGWILFRDRKRNYVQPKFREKKKNT